MQRIKFITIYVFLVALIVNPSSIADNKTLLLYSDDPLFLFEIEGILGELKNVSSGELLFTKIINLNGLAIEKSDSKITDSLLRIVERSSTAKKNSTLAILNDQDIISAITEADAYMRISVNWREPLIEYQFFITDDLPKTKKDEFPILFTSETRYDGTTLNTNEKNFKYELSKKIKSLFPISNHCPKLAFETNMTQGDYKKYYTSRKKEIWIDASNSVDYDDLKEDLQFKWRFIYHNNKDTTNIYKDPASLNSGATRQSLIFTNIGEFSIGVTLSDGICHSTEDTITIVVGEPPVILTQDTISITWRQLSTEDGNIPIGFIAIIYSDNQPKVNIVWATVEKKVGLISRLKGVRAPRSIPLSSDDLSTQLELISKDEISDTWRGKFFVPLKNAKYTIHFAISDGNFTSDTVSIYVDVTDRRVESNIGLVSHSIYIGDSTDVSFKSTTLRFRVRFNLSTNTSLSIGSDILLYEEIESDDIRKFDYPEISLFITRNQYSRYGLFLTRNWRLGYAIGVDIGKIVSNQSLVFEGGYYPGWFTFSLDLNFNQPVELGKFFIISGYLVTALK